MCEVLVFIRGVFKDLAEVTCMSLSALASTVDAHTTIHALTVAIFDVSSKDFDISAMVHMLTSFYGPHQLNVTIIAIHIGRESNLFSFQITLLSTTFEIILHSLSVCLFLIGVNRFKKFCFGTITI